MEIEEKNKFIMSGRISEKRRNGSLSCTVYRKRTCTAQLQSVLKTLSTSHKDTDMKNKTPRMEKLRTALCQMEFQDRKEHKGYDKLQIPKSLKGKEKQDCSGMSTICQINNRQNKPN